MLTKAATLKRLTLLSVVAVAMGSILLLSRIGGGQPATPPANASGLVVDVEKQNPWNHLKFNNASDTFRFAIVSDRTGGARNGVFERAVDQLNRMQPEFIVCVGDLIEGGNPKVLDRQWDEFNALIKKIDGIPFFYLPGNHDLGSKAGADLWQKQFGRTYYEFVYKNVLFLMLNTEDPPGAKNHIGQAQVDWAKKTLAAHPDVRWTFVFLHRPIWNGKNGDQKTWLQIEKALESRPHTVYAGHEHVYVRYERNGQKYYVLATTGGASRLRGAPLGEFDHIVWMTMKNDRPVMANLMLEGIYSDDVRPVRPPMGEVEKK